MTESGAPDKRHASVSNSGATAFGGNVSQVAGGDLAGRDLMKIGQLILNVAPAAHEAIHQLPGDVKDFTDREDVLAQIRSRLAIDARDSATSRVALNGAPGVGKSALAIHAAHQLSSMSEVQLYVNLAGGEGSTAVEPSEALATFLRALSVSAEMIPTGVEERAGWYRSLLAERRGLVVLDNARDEAQVRPLLPGGANCAVLITSQAPLAGLEGCWSYELQKLGRKDSVEMLEKLIGTERVGHEREQARRIAEMCGDLPLAIRICGSLLSKRSAWRLETLAAQLADEAARLGYLQAGDLSVGASFSVAYEQLHEVQRRLFRRLGVLPGQDFSLPVAAALVEGDVGRTERLLEQLLDAQLIESSTAGRFALHDLVRLYARQRLLEEESPKTQQAIRGAARGWYLELARLSAQMVRIPSPDQPSTRVLFTAFTQFVETETNNLVAAAHDAYVHQDWDATLAFARDLYGIFALRARWDSLERVTRCGLQAAQQASDRPGEGRTLNELGIVYLRQGRWNKAIDALKQSLAISRELNDRRGEGQTLCNLGNAYRHQDRWEEAIDALKQSVAILRELDDRRGEGQTLGNLGLVYQQQGRFEEAIDALKQSSAMLRDFGDRRDVAQTLNDLGDAYRDQDRCGEGIDALKQSLAIWRDVGDLGGEGQTLGNLGLVYQQQGRFDEAIDAYEHSLAIYRSFGDSRSEGHVLGNLGGVYQQQERWEDAITPLQRSLAISREFGERRRNGPTLNNLGNVYQALGRFEEAVDAYQQSLAIFRDFGDRRDEAQALNNLGMAYQEQGRVDEAVHAFEESAVAFAAAGDDRSAKKVRGILNAMAKREANPSRHRPRWRVGKHA